MSSFNNCKALLFLYWCVLYLLIHTLLLIVGRKRAEHWLPFI